jgi:hypothetical protein
MRSAAFFCLCAGILTLSGCAGAFDPYKRPGNWSATGAPLEIIAQQADNKADLIQGQSEPGTNGAVAVAGVQKAMTGGTATGLQVQLTTTAPGGGS